MRAFHWLLGIQVVACCPDAKRCIWPRENDTRWALGKLRKFSRIKVREC